jgi:hypothetical protein
MLSNSDTVFTGFIKSSAMRHINSPIRAASHGWVALGRFTKISLCIFVVIGGLVVIGGATINSDPFSQSPRLDIFWLEKDKKAPVDYGYGPGAGIGSPRPNLVLGQTPAIPQSLRLAQEAAHGTVPIGGGAGGFFGPPFPWPIIPLHMALLPDGSVMSYGTDQQGRQGGQIIYDVWDPKLGIGTAAHTILPNTTVTDLFCSAASLIGAGLTGSKDLTGKLLITGGDVTFGGVRNYSADNVNVFNPKNNTLTASGVMQYPRWYPSIITLRNGDKLLLGGRVSLRATDSPLPPEVFHPGSGWRTLQGMSISGRLEWVYPRGFVGFDGAVILLEHSGKIFRITTDGAGTMQDTGSLTSHGKGEVAYWYPSVMFAPFKVLTVRADKRAQVVDISSFPPVVTDVANLNYDRIWGNATVLPDGKILVTGGSGVINELTNVAYQSEIFDPAIGTWTLGASASIPRLYHSATLLLPDGSVLTGGGGAAGPVSELNGEIYYPAYLYAQDGSGNPAPRPQIVSAPSTLQLNHNFSVTVGSNDTVGWINLIRVGSNTHSFNSEERLIPVPFSQTGTTITATLSSSPELVPPGYYMLFVFNSSGVPAVAPIISVLQAVQ